MQLSTEGHAAIAAWEGVYLYAYDDATGHAIRYPVKGTKTIGIGHTRPAGKPFPEKDMTLTLREVFDIFVEDMKRYQALVRKLVKVNLAQHEFDALVSFCFNVGPHGMAESTMLERLNNGDRTGALKAWKWWNKITVQNVKVVSDGLVKRRQKEIDCFNGHYGNSPALYYIDPGTVTTLTRADILDGLADILRPDTEADIAADLYEPGPVVPNRKSRLLPPSRPRAPDRLIVDMVKRLEHLVPEGVIHDDVCVLAVRGYYENTLGAPGRNDRGLYDDAIFVVTPTDVIPFNGNTDPTAKFKPGLASFKAPQAVLYRPGLHGYKRKAGPYPAFRQAAPVTVERDGQGEDTGMFWINLHRGGATTTSSAGCQTVHPDHWNEFKNLVDDALELASQKTFYYLLIDRDRYEILETQIRADHERDEADSAKSRRSWRSFNPLRWFFGG